MASDAQLKLDNQVCFALYATMRTMVTAYRPLLIRLGLTYPQYLVMLVLWEQEGITVSQLGERLHLDSGTLTPLLKRLQAGGLVKRTRREGDEREVEVALSARGRALRRKALTVPRDILCKAGNTGVSLAGLRTDLKKVLGALQESVLQDRELDPKRRRLRQ